MYSRFPEFHFVWAHLLRRVISSMNHYATYQYRCWWIAPSTLLCCRVCLVFFVSVATDILVRCNTQHFARWLLPSYLFCCSASMCDKTFMLVMVCLADFANKCSLFFNVDINTKLSDLSWCRNSVCENGYRLGTFYNSGAIGGGVQCKI